MKKLLLTIALLGAIAPQIARAQEGAPITQEDVPVPVNEAKGQIAKVTPLIEGLKEPQGLALDSNGDILVCDTGAGEVLRFSATGQKKEVVAGNLKSPSQITTRTLFDRVTNKTVVEFLVSERKANRVVRLRNGIAYPVGSEIIEPVGLLDNSNATNGGLYAVAHTTSVIYRLDRDKWTPVYQAPDQDGDKGRYGLRCLASYGTSLLVSDEVKGQVLKLSRAGELAKLTGGIDDPSGVAVRDDRVYVCDEGAGGKLWQVDQDGIKTLVAQELGRPRNVLFLNDDTALVSDRDGRVLKLTWE